MSPEERARNIMDNVCLSESDVRSGVDAELRLDIAKAIREAVAEEREAIMHEVAALVHDQELRRTLYRAIRSRSSTTENGE